MRAEEAVPAPGTARLVLIPVLDGEPWAPGARAVLGVAEFYFGVAGEPAANED